MQKEISTSELAELLGASTRNIQLLTQKGVLKALPKKGKGNGNRYDSTKVVQAYIEYIEDKAAKPETSGLEESLLLEEVRLKGAKATIAQHQKEENESQYHRADDIEAVFDDLILHIREEVEKLPDAITERLFNSREEHNGEKASENAAIIKEEVCKILYKLSEYSYDPDEYEKRKARL